MMVDIPKIRQRRENYIKEKIDEINEPNLNLTEKRLRVLDLMNSSTDIYPEIIDFPNNTIILFNIKKIRNYREQQIQKRINNIKSNKSYIEKRLIVLDDMNSSSSSDNEKSFEEELDSTWWSSFIDNDNDNKKDEKKNYWLKYKLYDIKLEVKNIDIKLPKLYPINNETFCYFYLNKLTTYHFIKSAQFDDEYIINDIKYDSNECKYNESLGLFFCGKDIELDNGKEIKKCAPNSMFCKDCMEKNKKRYKLKNRYLININGRPSKKRKVNNKEVGYHCFGHFLLGNQSEVCLEQFSCEACQLLDKYEKYFFS